MLKTTYTDITGWMEKPFLQTGGTREKCWVLNPHDEKDYFFKVSIKKEKIDYRSEFWMEIIASKVGQMLGLHMLDYNIARKDAKIGCLSCNMCQDNEELVEITRMLTGYDESYNPASKEDQERYTFDFLVAALKSYNLDKYIPSIIQVLIFDSIIGNQDRHQDNWGFLNPLSHTDQNKRKIFSLKAYKEKRKWENAKFSPVYDSGSCLGRELPEEKVTQMRTDDLQLNAYINRGKAELRWQDVKMSYNELIECLIKDNTYGKTTLETIRQISSAFDEKQLRDIVENVDADLPEEYQEFKLSKERKEFVVKLITTRVLSLRKTVQSYV